MTRPPIGGPIGGPIRPPVERLIRPLAPRLTGPELPPIETGPEHDRTYVVEVFAGNRSLARGEGGSRKKAETTAAAAALAGGLGAAR